MSDEIQTENLNGAGPLDRAAMDEFLRPGQATPAAPLEQEAANVTDTDTETPAAPLERRQCKPCDYAPGALLVVVGVSLAAMGLSLLRMAAAGRLTEEDEGVPGDDAA